MEISLKLDQASAKQLINNLRQVLANVKIDAGRALYDFARDVIMMESAEECPRDTWTLVSSGYVKEPEYHANEVSVKLGYGGPEDKMNPKTHKMASDYMLTVHEDLMARHPVGKSKFFEDPVRRNEQLLLEHLGGRIRTTINIGVGR